LARQHNIDRRRSCGYDIHSQYSHNIMLYRVIPRANTLRPPRVYTHTFIMYSNECIQILIFLNIKYAQGPYFQIFEIYFVECSLAN